MTRFSLQDPGANRDLARRLSPALAAGDVIGLRGPLGTGKTTFARAMIEALAEAGGRTIGEVPSPTFTLVQIYETGVLPVWHLDLYRLERPGDAVELAIEEAFASALCLIEWPEKLGSLLPPQRLEIAFEFDGPGRTAEARGFGARGAVLRAALEGAMA